MIIIGLTGGIASGKSSVAKELKRLGAEIIDADLIAREVVEPGQLAWRNLIDYFGKDILFTDGTINRKKLAAYIFEDEQKRKKLEDITHPEILAALKDRVAKARSTGRKILVLDIPLLIEVNWTNLVDKVWLVYVDHATQIRRLIQRDNITLSEAELRLAAQMPLETKKKYADVIIDNTGTFKETKSQILKAWENFSHAH